MELTPLIDFTREYVGWNVSRKNVNQQLKLDSLGGIIVDTRDKGNVLIFCLAGQRDTALWFNAGETEIIDIKVSVLVFLTEEGDGDAGGELGQGCLVLFFKVDLDPGRVVFQEILAFPASVFFPWRLLHDLQLKMKGHVNW